MAAKYYIPKSGQKVNIEGLSDKPLNRVLSLADQGKTMRARNVALRQQNKALKNPAAPAATTTAPVTPAAAATTVAPPQAAPGTAQTLFPSARIFEPQNYEGSPLYKFQVDQGQKQLAKSLAARGLTNSGYGIQQELNIPMRAAAQDTERMTNLATANADRLYNLQQNEASRLERQGNNQWNRMYQTAGLLAQQSPWQAAVNGLDNSANALNDRGQEQMNFLRDFYQRTFAPAPGPMAVTPPQSAPPATQPNYIASKFAQSMSDAARNQDIADFLASLINTKPTVATTGAK